MRPLVVLRTHIDPCMHAYILAPGKSVLCVLDDVWDAAAFAALHFIDPRAGSVVLLTTRIRELVKGATEARDARRQVLLLSGLHGLLDSNSCTPSIGCGFRAASWRLQFGGGSCCERGSSFDAVNKGRPRRS